MFLNCSIEYYPIGFKLCGYFYIFIQHKICGIGVSPKRNFEIGKTKTTLKYIFIKYKTYRNVTSKRYIHGLFKVNRSENRR